jgi:hypothetical protein
MANTIFLGSGLLHENSPSSERILSREPLLLYTRQALQCVKPIGRSIMKINLA